MFGSFVYLARFTFYCVCFCLVFVCLCSDLGALEYLFGSDMDRGKKVVIEDEEEEEPIHISESQPLSDESLTLCLIGKLWTERSYNSLALMDTMKKLWNPPKGMTCRELGSNLISFQFNAKRDMERVLAMEPWHFNKHVLMLNAVTAAIQPSLIPFSKAPFWIRLYDVPIIGREKDVLQKIGTRFGEVIEMDSTTIGGLSRSVRMKVLLDLGKPIKRGTKIKIGSNPPCWLPATYERLPSFCYWCGKLGHTHKDCEQLLDQEDKEGSIEQNQMPYGDWMRASPMKNIQMMTERNADGRDTHRRSLFTGRTPLVNQHEAGKKKIVADQQIEKESGETNTIKQLSDLVKSLEKVEVDPKRTLSPTVQPDTQTPTTNQMPHHPIILNTPPPPLIPTGSKPTQPTTTHINQNNHKPPYSLPPTIPQPKYINPTLPKSTPVTFTPISVLRKIVEQQSTHIRQNQAGPHTPKPLIPTDTTTTLLKVKTEPISPVKRSDKKPAEAYASSKWKRKTSDHIRQVSSSIVVQKKRKDNLMDVDLTYLGGLKRTKNETGKHSIAMAEADGQPRRSS